MTNCPICSRPTLRHIQRNHIYWYCIHCHLAVPYWESPNTICKAYKRYPLPRLPELAQAQR